MRKLTLFLSCLVPLAIILAVIFFLGTLDDGDTNDRGPSETTIINELLYNDSVNGYNSAIWYGYFAPIGVAEDLEVPDLENLTFNVYTYSSVKLSDDYIEDTIDTFFPDIDLKSMDIQTSTEHGEESPFIRIMNETCEIRLLRSGGVHYKDLRDYARSGNSLDSCENATAVADAYLKDHGGIPEDIDEVETSPMSLLSLENSSIITGAYCVQYYRNVSGHPLEGSSLCNHIMLKIDSADGTVHEFRWHWVDLDLAFDIVDPEPIDKVLDYYGMASPDIIRTNISWIELIFQVPYTVQEWAYDTSSEDYYVAPYWKVYTEDGRYYFLGILTPESHPG